MSQIVNISTFPKTVNSVYHKIFKDKSRYIVLFGSAGSGKSVAVGQKIIWRMLSEHNHRFLVARKIENTIRESARAEIIGAINSMGVRSLFSFSESPTGEMTIKCPNNNIILFKGLDNRESLKSIKDISGMWLEECTDFTIDDFTQLDLRLRGEHLKNYKQIMLSFNPVSATHWLKERFFDKKDSNALVIHTTYRDNKWIDEEYIRILERLKDTNPRYYNVYALGQWGTAEGVIFQNVKVRIIREEEIKGLECLQGLDWGYTDPNTFIKLFIDLKGMKIYIYDGFHEKGLLNSQIANKIKDMNAHKTVIRADSAEPKSIEALKTLGIHRIISAQKGKDSVNAGINYLCEFEIIINSHLTEIINDFENYAWDTDREGNAINKPNHAYSHSCDATRYACSHLALRRGKVGRIAKPIGI